MEPAANPLARWIEHHAEAVPDQLAVRTRQGAGRTFAELDRRANQAANALRGLGVRPGERIALWMDDSVANVETYVAAAKIGAVLTPINARLQAPEVSFILERCDPRVVLYADQVAERLDRCRAEGATDGRLLWATGSERVGSDRRYESDVAAARTTRPRPAPYAPDDTFVIGFSSGTTGRPKGASISGRGIQEIAVISALARRLSYFGTSLIATSLSFPATIMASVFTTLYTAGSVILMGQGWDVDELLDVVERERATYTTVLSPHVLDFTEAVRKRPAALTTLRSILHSGSKMSAPELAALHDAVGTRLIEVWGMVEHSGGPVTATTVDDYLRIDEAGQDLFGSVGRAVAQCAVEVVDPDGNPLPHDGRTVGELVVSSPALMTGYWNDPEATAVAMRGGWYHSGDLGVIDAQGYVAIVDRRKDLIVSGGANIYPSEVERVLLECPGVRAAVVVGVQHERWGRTPVAAIISDASADLSAEAVLRHVRANLASYKKPTQIKFVDAFPLNASGKVIRAEVAALFSPPAD